MSLDQIKYHRIIKWSCLGIILLGDQTVISKLKEVQPTAFSYNLFTGVEYMAFESLGSYLLDPGEYVINFSANMCQILSEGI